MVTDLQELVDDLAEVLDRPVALDDRNWRLLAASAYLDGDDPVRRHSLLARTASEEVASWLHQLGLQNETELIETPENDALGMRPRIVAPVRKHGISLAFLWVIAGETALDSADRQAVEVAAEQVARILWDRRTHSSAEQAQEADLLAALLDSADPFERARAESALAERPGWEGETPFALALARVTSADVCAEVGERVRRRWHADSLLWRSRGSEVTVLARLAGSPATDVAGLLQSAGVEAAVVAQSSDLGEARVLTRGLSDGLLVLERLPAAGPVASLEDLGAWPQVARLWDACGRPERPRLLEALLEHRHAADLIEALEATLDAAGDVAGAAERIHVHRSTLYRRLDLVEELTGLSLHRGDDLLQAHLALRSWRLAIADAE